MSTRVSRRAFIGLAGIAAVSTAGYLATNRLGWVYFRDALALKYFDHPLRIGSIAEFDQEEQFDVCIIGSGPAGAVLGLDLVKQGYRVIMLESGFDPSQKRDARFTELEVFESSGSLDYPVAGTRVRAVGGTSNVWTGRCPRLYPIDFEPNAYTPEGAAWPVRYEELELYYSEAEMTLRVSGGKLSAYHAPRKNDLPLPAQDDISDLSRLAAKAGVTIDHAPTSTGMNFLGKGPIRIATDLLPEFTRSEQARLISGVTVTRLLANSNGMVEGAEIKTLDGVTKTVKARIYVVACGALESARLLLLSRSSQFPSGLGNEYDRVGRCFMEHPNFLFRAKIPNMKTSADYEMGRSHQFYEELKKEGFGSAVLFFSRQSQRPDTLAIGATVEMAPADSNRVALSSKLKDFYGSPVSNLALSFSEADLKTQARVSQIIEGIFKELGAADMRGGELNWSHHHMGTCRMGNDPKTSVVNLDLRVHSSENLYVAGSAVFVTAGASHPTLAITAFSHRLAAHLTDRLGAASQTVRSEQA